MRNEGIVKSLKVAVTGAAGFIGSYMVQTLQNRGHKIAWAVDSFKPAYGGKLCEFRSNHLNPDVHISKLDLVATNPEKIASFLKGADVVVHLAAFAGVRQGESAPHEYTRNNILGTSAILTACEYAKPKLVLVASSSSVYGNRGINGACTENQADGTGIKSHYAMTKWINELQAQDFNRRTKIPTFALRFFTVFGEWGRPDMAYSSFASAILNSQPVTLYGSDGGVRNMTHVRDATDMVVRLVENSLIDCSHLGNTFESFNIATGEPLSALSMLKALEIGFNAQAEVFFSERPDVDAAATHADTRKLQSIIKNMPSSNVELKLQEYASWYSKGLHLH